MSSYANAGPYTIEDLLGIWQAAVDQGYARPFIEAGEGSGLEVFTQAFDQLSRVSDAINTSMQSLYMLPWSGQSAPQASGPGTATVQLAFVRGTNVDKPLVLGAGLIYVEEQQTDWGLPTGVPALTGRRYVIQETVCFHPGDTGPLLVTAAAEAPGQGYNNPLPGTIQYVPQPGTAFNNQDAWVNVTGPFAPGPPQPRSEYIQLVTINESDMFVPQHVGQYVKLTAGPNAGLFARITGWLPPDTTVPRGTIAVLGADSSWQSQPGAFAGTFTPNEPVAFTVAGVLVGTGTLLGAPSLQASGALSYTFVVQTFATAVDVRTATMTGATSGATAVPGQKLYDVAFAITPDPPTPFGTTAWAVLDWVQDFGLLTGNALSPTGGQLAVLDELGYERNVFRGPGESDASYSTRVAQVADVVTPNAIRRTCARVLGAAPFCFREVGGSLWPGFFYDGNARTTPEVAGSFTPDAYDYDVVTVTGLIHTFKPFLPNEPVELRDGLGNVIMRGWTGTDNLTSFTPTIIRVGLNTPPSSVAFVNRLVGLWSGAALAQVGPLAYYATTTTYRFHELLDYTDFRATFLVGVAGGDAGDFGFAYDVGPFGAFDASPYEDFWDGYGVTTANTYRVLWQALNAVRAGGAGFYVYLETQGCE